MPVAPLIGQIVPFACNFAPRGYLMCAGQLLPIAQNPALFSILGTFYGGNGTSNFALPDLRGRVAIHQGTGAGLTPRVVGEIGGEENVLLVTANMPSHNHPAIGTNNPANFPDPAGESWAADGAGVCTQFSNGSPNAQMSTRALDPAGGNVPHNNVSPVLAITYCIAVTGIFPSRN